MDSHIKSSSSRMLVDSGNMFQSAIPHSNTLVSFKALGEEEEDSTSQPRIRWIDEWMNQYKFWIEIKQQPQLQQPPLSRGVTSQIEKQSIDLKVSLQMLLKDATIFVNCWTNKFKSRSFSNFRFTLQTYGLDWHKYNVSECVQQSDLEFIAQPNHAVHTHPTHVVSTHPDWVMANKYYCRSLALMRLLQKIRSESSNAFSQQQASKLMSFLGHLIMIQQEQRVVVKTISDHLEQLRRLASGDILQTSCKNRRSQHPTHPHDSLYAISRESTWLLKKLKDSHSASSSFIVDSVKIVDTLVEFIRKYKESKEDKGILIQQFGNHIKRLQEEGVGKGTVIETLLGCLEHVCNVSMTDYVEATGELDFPWFRALCGGGPRLGCGGGSPLGCITLWRILFESSAAGLEKYYEALELEAIRGSDQPRIGGNLDLLMSDWEKVLLGFVDMHKTVAEISYMLGDAFTTGGAGMNSLRDEAASQSKNDEETEMDMVYDFPWDKHNVRARQIEDPNILESLLPRCGPSYASCS